MPPRLTFACALACGVMVANLYYAQPLIALMGPSLHLSAGLGGLIVSVTQLGYGAGLFLIVSLADRVENRRLILTTQLCAALALAAAAMAPSAPFFLVASAVVGISSAGAQVVVPFAAALAPEESRGRTIGNVMAGLLAGIMLARPAASIIANFAGWRTVFWISSGLMLVLAGWLARVLPERHPHEPQSYRQILVSMLHILKGSRTLQRRAVYQGLAFAIFNIFWTASPLMLAHSFGFTQKGIALFALAGAGGALIAPIAGRLGDRGHLWIGTAIALTTLVASCVLSGWALVWGSMPLLVILAITLDGGTQLNQILGQRVVFALRPEARGRVNAIYMTIVFIFGAAGSSLATLSYQRGGWWAAMLVAAGLGLIGLALFATERRAPMT
jgi:predicted MFS family arabinose efflux permease